MARRSVRTLVGTLSILAVCSCAAPPAKTGVTVEPKGNNPGPASTAKPPVVTQTSQGRVLGLDGQPAVGVKVVATLISQDGGGLIGQDGAGVVAQGGGNYALQAAEETLQTTTGTDGGFKLELPAGRKANVEAVLDADVKAIKLGVERSEGLELKLDHVGSIAGKVLAPSGSTVTNLQGTQVYLPGTSYAALTDEGGAFTITGVPAGAFPLLVAEKGNLNGKRANVVVTPKGVARVDDLQLAAQKPVIQSLEPAVLPREGGKVVIKGTSFGASTGAEPQVYVGGALVAGAVAKDDQTIEFALPKDSNGGDVVVTVNGASSNAKPLNVFYAVWVEAAGRALWKGSTQAIKAFVANSRWEEIPDVEVKWSVAGGTFTVDEKGVVTAVRVGSSELKAEVGGVSRTLFLTVFDKPFVTTLLGPARLPDGKEGEFNPDEVGGGPVGIALGPDGLVYLTETVSDGIGRIEANGLLKAVAGKNLQKAVGQLWLESWPAEPLEPLASKMEMSFTPGLLDGPADQALFHDPSGLAFDGRGNLFVADSQNHAIRKVDLADPAHPTVSTVAGKDEPGKQDGALAEALFKEPSAIAVDASGNLFVADTGNKLVRKLDLAAGTASTFATGFTGPSDLAFDGAGKLYVLDRGSKSIRTVTPAGEVKPLAGPDLQNPTAIAVARDGTVYVADGFVTIHAIAPDGKVSLVHRSTNSDDGKLTDGPLGDARFGEITRMVLDARGNLLYTDEGYRIVRKIVLKGP